jgi:hypothetical protein
MRYPCCWTARVLNLQEAMMGRADALRVAKQVRQDRDIGL